MALTEHQFEELRTYEHGNPSWRGYRPNSNLIRRNLLTHSRAQGFYEITSLGLAALADFRARYGIRDREENA